MTGRILEKKATRPEILRAHRSVQLYNTLTPSVDLRHNFGEQSLMTKVTRLGRVGRSMYKTCIMACDRCQTRFRSV